jgi:hypothetical protein
VLSYSLILYFLAVYSCVWFVAVFGVFDATGTIDNVSNSDGSSNQNSDATSEDNSMTYFYFVLLLLGLFWLVFYLLLACWMSEVDNLNKSFAKSLYNAQVRTSISEYNACNCCWRGFYLVVCP